MTSLTDYALVLHKADNVATALREIPSGEYLHNKGQITIPEPINAGFKVATDPIRPGEPVRKYGYVIGLATEAIDPGVCVHVHNMKSSVQ